MVREGIVRRDTLVRQASDTEWTRAANVAGLFADPALALPGRPRSPMSIPVLDGRDRLPDQGTSRWLWISVLVACLVLVVVWLAVARQMAQKQRRRQGLPPVVASAIPQPPLSPDQRTEPRDVCRNEVRTLVGHTDIVKALAFSPDGRLLLSGEGSIQFQREKAMAESPKHESDLERREGTSASPEVEEHSGGFCVRVWEVETGRRLQALKGHRAMVSAVAFSPDGRYALSADNAGIAILWDTRNWTELHRFLGSAREQYGLGETRAINAVAFSPDSRRAVLAGWGYDEGRSSANYDKNPHLVLWSIETGEELTRTDKNDTRQSYFDGPAFVDELHSAAYTPNGKYVVTGASGSNAGMYYYRDDGTVYRAAGDAAPKSRVLRRDHRNPDRFVYEVEDRNFGSSGHDSPSASFVSTALSPDGRRAVSADTLSRVCLWVFTPVADKPEMGVGRISQMDLLDRPVRCVAFSPIGQYIATGGEDLLLWHGTRDELEVARELGPTATGTFQAKPFHIHSLAFSPNGQYLAAGCDDHRIRLWKVP